MSIAKFPRKQSCLICNKSKYPICSRCKVNPFMLEQLRDVLASNSYYKELKKFYTKEYPEIEDLNNQKFWNERLFSNEILKNQDGMTRNRIKITESMIPKNARKILDIGIGHGFVEELICDRNIELYGIDISDKSVKNLQKKFSGNFSVQSIYKMKFYKNSFNVVLALEVLEHIPPSRILNVLKNIHKMLIKNGSFILSVPTNEGLKLIKNNPNGHVRIYTENLIKAELELSGFKVIDVKTLHAFKDLYFLKNALSKIFTKRWHANNIIINSIVL